MNESPRIPSLVVPLVLAVTVLVLGFGGGVGIGWSTRARRPSAPEKSTVKLPDAEVERALAACERELQARAKARMTRPIQYDAGLESAAKVDALQKEVTECRVRETLTNAHVCGTINDHINLNFVLTFSTLCVGNAATEEFLVNSLDKCTEFGQFSAHLDEDELTQEEKIRFAQSDLNHRFETKDNLIAGIQRTRRECRRIWALPPE